ncbi:hypothetical protein [Streptomyces sp. NPDC001422]
MIHREPAGVDVTASETRMCWWTIADDAADPEQRREQQRGGEPEVGPW